jgi:transcriptional regulator with XRE-family HTH domain
MPDTPIQSAIRAYIARTGESERGLSVRAGVNDKTVNQILAGKMRSNRGDTLMKLAAAMDMDLSSLLGKGATERGAPTGVPSLPEHTPRNMPGVPEIDGIGGLGSGSEGIVEAFTAGETDIISADAVKEFWGLPPAYLGGELGMKLANVRILEVRGDSMEPTLHSTDRVMVNLADRIPTPEGLFAFFDGYGVAVKRLEIIPRSDPPSVLAIADNPKHTQRTYAFDEVNIIGRVVWVARRM